jgi:GDP-mannose 6-dehydrogenase
MNITVIGLGYVGTVSAACLACKGHIVWGADINADKVRIINEGRSPIVENGLEARVAQGRASGRLLATCDAREALQHTDICFVAVATPSRPNGQIDPAHLFRACEQIAGALVSLDRRQTVVIRSSVLPAVLQGCAEIFSTKAPGRVALCANPEFLREGTAIHDFEKPPFTLLGVDDPDAELTLRSLYSDLEAPLFVLPPREALLVKYASNTFHALKVVFANEIGALCRETGIDANSVMSVFCKDTKLNVSPRYLMPGFAFGGSCLPKDVRALLYAAKQADLELPTLNSLLASNNAVIDRAVRQICVTGKRRLGLIGLSFKSNTDDLRESPFVDLAERLLGKGYELKIYDPNVSLARLTGANKEYINRVIPHLSRLLVQSLGDLIDCDLVLVGHRYQGVEAFISEVGVDVIELSDQMPRAQMMEAVACD